MFERVADIKEITDINTETVDGKRYYVSPSGEKYPYHYGYQ